MKKIARNDIYLTRFNDQISRAGSVSLWPSSWSLGRRQQHSVWNSWHTSLTNFLLSITVFKNACFKFSFSSSRIFNHVFSCSASLACKTNLPLRELLHTASFLGWLIITPVFSPTLLNSKLLPLLNLGNKFSCFTTEASETSVFTLDWLLLVVCVLILAAFNSWTLKTYLSGNLIPP